MKLKIIDQLLLVMATLVMALAMYRGRWDVVIFILLIMFASGLLRGGSKYDDDGC